MIEGVEKGPVLQQKTSEQGKPRCFPVRVRLGRGLLVGLPSLVGLRVFFGGNSSIRVNPLLLLHREEGVESVVPKKSLGANPEARSSESSSSPTKIWPGTTPSAGETHRPSEDTSSSARDRQHVGAPIGG
ncbi:hypothetical protein DFH08DRAFT_806945 [Mycena albidolilacea]|uniref:Uncharacterized protein n=1 Tax=Mycena albidolilacea TaxID=1033008 RepID=A0AAD7A5V0_9AGAR|nr:hypothetical protein DFH08DRAFT_806945 [Mycena albidolilacea]